MAAPRQPPYGEDDGILRTLALGSTTLAALVAHETKTITVLQINYLG
ncbi:hypothetical protein [Streptomyces sp. NPDC051109]